MFRQELCKARIRSFLVTGMNLTISVPIKSQTCSAIFRSGDWDGRWMVDKSCCSNHVTVRCAMWAGALSCWNTNGWFLSPNMYCTCRIKKVFWQCSDIILPCVDVQVYISPRLFSIPSPPATMCKVEPWFMEKSKQAQLSGTVHLRVLVHQSSSSSSEPVFETNVRILYSNTAVDCLTMEPSLDSSFGNWMSKVYI